MHFLETKRPALLSRTRIAVVLAVLLLAFLPGCTRGRYYTGALSSPDLVGSWEIVEQSAPPRLAADIKGGRLVLRADGTFESGCLPWTNSRDELEFVHEAGRWELIDHQHEGLRSRWTLSLQLSKRHEVVKWDVFVSENERPHLGLVYDLDSNSAVLFAKAAR